MISELENVHPADHWRPCPGIDSEGGEGCLWQQPGNNNFPFAGGPIKKDFHTYPGPDLVRLFLFGSQE